MIRVNIDQKVLKKVYKRREPWSHKGDFGKLLIIGGSNDYPGSPGLVAMSALRSGCDSARIMAPRRSADICASFSPEIMSTPLGNELGTADFDGIKAMSEWSTAVSLGNGLGVSSEKKELVNMLAEKIKKKMVIDADALKMLNKENLNRGILITPNSNEFEVLFGIKLSTSLDERAKAAESMAREYGTTILLKGHVDVISDGNETFINKVNSIYMTKAGTGDTLAGICAGLVAQKNQIVDSACAAAFINGYSGKTAARYKKESLSVMDIVNEIGSTITKFRSS
ncbi:MAG: NAD(P)H-hydrate dehydratase [Candidatus Parvarchaeota archaeon]|jgi:NAD(P)H-hydrate epimerase|nr:NAD(P)H-hydrate dehydratase [Candidatus Parvarchaeota archaeon]